MNSDKKFCRCVPGRMLGVCLSLTLAASVTVPGLNQAHAEQALDKPTTTNKQEKGQEVRELPEDKAIKKEAATKSGKNQPDPADQPSVTLMRDRLPIRPAKATKLCEVQKPVMIDDLLEKMYLELMSNGDELLKRKRVENARRAYAAALALEPDTKGTSLAASRLIATFSSQGENWVQKYRQWAESNTPTAKQRTHLDLVIGECLYRTKEFNKAIAALEPIAKQQTPTGRSASIIWALCLLAKGQRSAAIEKLTAVVDQPNASEEGAKAMFLVGWIHLQAQEYAKAKTTFDKVVKKHPQSRFTQKARALSKRLLVFTK